MKIKVKANEPLEISNGRLVLRSTTEVKLKAPTSSILKKHVVKEEQDKEHVERYRKVTFTHGNIPVQQFVLPKGFKAELDFVVPYVKLEEMYEENGSLILYVTAFGNTTIRNGAKVAEVGIVPANDSKWHHKLKWLFSNGIKLKVNEQEKK